MPYKHGHYFVGAVLIVILGGFWASYFAPIGTAPRGTLPLAFHVHAFTAIAWLLLVIVQHVSIHRRANAFHKQMGKANFVLFPLLILGFTMIIDVSARRYAAQQGAFIMHNGPAFGIGMAIAIAAYLTLYYQALKNRRNVKLHAGYMLATPLILFESPFGRLMDQFFPWMNFIGSEGPQVVQDQIAISDGLAILFAMTLYFMDRKHGAPWLVAACFMGLQGAVMWFAPGVPLLGTLFLAYSAIPLPVVMAAGLAAGALAGWLGWRAGGQATIPVKTAPATA